VREHTTDAQQKGGSTTCKGALRADRGALRANRGARRASGEARRAKENTTCRTSVEGAGSQTKRLVCGIQNIWITFGPDQNLSSSVIGLNELEL